MNHNIINSIMDSTIIANELTAVELLSVLLTYVGVTIH
jgi:hypothetical protein